MNYISSHQVIKFIAMDIFQEQDSDVYKMFRALNLWEASCSEARLLNKQGQNWR